ncbi:MAG: cation diffusion facilitator family transporter [Bradymonadales bacterium]|jgi:cation diffusion facilitator family transporter
MLAETSKKTIKRVTWLGAIINVLLACSKLLVGYFFHSRTLIADGIHSLSDLISDAAVLIGVRYWSEGPDEDHQYGHARIETLVTVFIAVMLFLAAVFIVIDAYRNIGVDKEAPSAVAAVVAFVSIISKECLFRWTRAKSKQCGSSALYANAWHHRSDALSSIPALIAIILALIRPEWQMFDEIGAIVVAGILTLSAFKIMLPALSQLIDGGSSAEQCLAIAKIAMQIDGVRDAHAVRTRSLGDGIYADLHIEVDPYMTVLLAHEISERVQEALIEKGPKIVDVIVHIEPYHGKNNAKHETH